MRVAVVLLAVASALSACSDPAPSPPPEPAADPVVEPSPSAAAPADPAPTEPAAAEPAVAEAEPAPSATPTPPPVVVAPPAPEPAAPRADGLPEATRGPLVRLPSVEVTERTVGTRRVPSVAIRDAESRARLDELLAEGAREGRCRVPLATETLVTLHCVSSYSEWGEVPTRDFITRYYRVGTGGDVERIELESLLLDGARVHDLKPRFLYRPRTLEQRLVLTQTGLTLTSFDSIQDGPRDEIVVRVGYRALAPYVRRGTALGDLLEAQGLALAEAGTRMPPLPEPSPAIWGSGAERLVATYWRLPARERALARLITPGGQHPAALIFPPGTDASALSAAGNGGEALYLEPHASFALARASQRLDLRESPGPRSNVLATVPTGSIVAVVDGMVGDVDSRLARGGWALVSTSRGDTGWARGADLVTLDACAPAAGSASDLVGSGELTRAGTAVAFAFVVAQGALTIFPLQDGCAPGAPLQRIDLAGERLDDVLVARTAREGGDSLLVVITGPESQRTLSAYALGADAPLVRRAIGAEPVSVAVSRRGEHAPIRIGQGARAIALAWNGTTLEEPSAR